MNYNILEFVVGCSRNKAKGILVDWNGIPRFPSVWSLTLTQTDTLLKSSSFHFLFHYFSFPFVAFSVQWTPPKNHALSSVPPACGGGRVLIEAFPMRASR